MFNPLLEWYYDCIKPVRSIYQLPQQPIKARLCELFYQSFGITLTTDPFYDDAISFARANVASGLLSDEIISAIYKFSNGHIWECGAGSGYNSFLLKQSGAQVYSTDCTENWFQNRFAKVHDNPRSCRIRNIIDRGGCLLYIWPTDQYHHLETWLKNGGSKVIIIGDFGPCHHTIAEYQKNNIPYDLEDIPTTCPIFGQDLPEWQLWYELEPPHFDSSISDVVQFWVKKPSF